MPVNRAYPLAKLLPAVKAFSEKHGRMVTLEFILIEEVNDGLEQAEKLRDIALDLHAHVNLIPYNSVRGCRGNAPPSPARNGSPRCCGARASPSRCGAKKATTSMPPAASCG
jgi:adenine C2-methylase RlmN of 23S rRNA A2503 and tRNA A37